MSLEGEKGAISISGQYNHPCSTSQAQTCTKIMDLVVMQSIRVSTSAALPRKRRLGEKEATVGVSRFDSLFSRTSIPLLRATATHEVSLPAGLNWDGKVHNTRLGGLAPQDHSARTLMSSGQGTTRKKPACCMYFDG